MQNLKATTVLDNDHIRIKYDKVLGIFIANWKNNLPITMETFKVEMMSFLSIFQKEKPRHVIWLQEGFTTEITPETHLWVEDNVNRVCKDNGLEKVAFVVGKDVMAHLSVFNFFEEVKSCLQPKHFAGLEEAYNWIYEKGDELEIDTDEISIEYLGLTKSGKSQFSIETSAKDTEGTLKSFKNIIRENAFLKKHAEKFYSLTQREREVFKLYANGEGFKDIAEKLYLSEFTVRTHWRNTKKKLQIKSHSDIAQYKNSFLS